MAPFIALRTGRLLYSRSLPGWVRSSPWTVLWLAAWTVSLLLIYFLAGPALAKIRYRSDLSWYDTGLYGFYPTQDYVSFDCESPLVKVLTWDPQCESDYLFLNLRGGSIEHGGPAILDSDGQLVCMAELDSVTANVQPQKYRGESYLTYWNGDIRHGHGEGSFYMV